jgi:ABC-type phosphate transport system substrate-binding protein
MRGMRTAILLSIAVCWLTLGRPPGAAGALADPVPLPSYRVIVHPENKEAALGRAFLADAFLKKVTRWRSGEVVRPVDQPLSSAVRRKFSDEVLGRSVAAVRSYWQQLIFAGRDVPPPELESDAAVIAYVLRTPGAVGYVSGSASLGAAKPLAVK